MFDSIKDNIFNSQDRSLHFFSFSFFTYGTFRMARNFSWDLELMSIWRLKRKPEVQKERKWSKALNICRLLFWSCYGVKIKVKQKETEAVLSILNRVVGFQADNLSLTPDTFLFCHQTTQPQLEIETGWFCIFLRLRFRMWACFECFLSYNKNDFPTNWKRNLSVIPLAWPPSCRNLLNTDKEAIE